MRASTAEKRGVITQGNCFGCLWRPDRQGQWGGGGARARQDNSRERALDPELRLRGHGLPVRRQRR